MRILPILSKRAISVACCPPAFENNASIISQSCQNQLGDIGHVPPPKLARLQGINKKYKRQAIMEDHSARGHAYTCFDSEWPFASVSDRIGRHMVSFATLMNLVLHIAKSGFINSTASQCCWGSELQQHTRKRSHPN
jgi:hypothetical protein